MKENRKNVKKTGKKRRGMLILLSAVIAFLLLTAFVALDCESIILDIVRYRGEIQANLDQISDSFDDSVRETEDYTEDCRTRAMNRAVFLTETAFPDGIRAHVEELPQILSGRPFLILDASGTVIYSGLIELPENPAELNEALRQCEETNEPVLVNAGGHAIVLKKDRNNDVLVLDADLSEMDLPDSRDHTPQEIIESIGGEDAFAAAAKDHVLVFSGAFQKELTGKSELEFLSSNSILRPEAHSISPGLCFLGNSLYLYLSQDTEENGYTLYYFQNLLSAASRSNASVNLLFLIMILIIIILSFYLYQLRRHPFGIAADRKQDYRWRAATCTLLGACLVVIAAYYCRTLFCLSNYVMNDQEEIERIAAAGQSLLLHAEETDSMYAALDLQDTELIAHWLEMYPERADHASLTKIADEMDANYIALFDSAGRQLTGSGDYINLKISEKEEDASYELQKLLIGTPAVIVKNGNDDLTCQKNRMIGITLRDETDAPDGFVLAGFAFRHSEDTSFPFVLKRAGNSALNQYYLINPETKAFTYASDHRLTGLSAAEYGFSSLSLNDRFSGELTINSVPCYASSGPLKGEYLYVALPTATLFENRLIFAVQAGAVAAVVILLIALVLRSVKPSESAAENDRYVTVKTDAATSKQSLSVLERWSLTVNWSRLNAEDRTALFIKAVFIALFAVILALILLKPEIFRSSPILMFILEEKWTPGLNIYAFTAFLVLSLIVSIIVTIIRSFLVMISRSLTPKMETACRLLRSFIEYASVLGLLYCGLLMAGVNVASLAASAGILTLIVGLGAEDMVKDLVSGLFLIFESEFQVGDRIVLGDRAGQVREIGILSTKMADNDNNIFIVKNSEISDVLNQTIQSGISIISFPVSSEIPIPEIQDLFARELPLLSETIPGLLSEPKLRSVSLFSGGEMQCKVIFEVTERKRFDVTCRMNRELVRILTDSGFMKG